MVNLLNDIVAYDFLQNALIACVLSGITCGIVGSYIVARRMVFLAGGITHASFGGLGMALWAGFNPVAGALGFAALSSLGIEYFSRRSRIREDSATGIVWSVGMALGALFMSLRPGYQTDLTSYLFGNILLVDRVDIISLAVLTRVKYSSETRSFSARSAAALSRRSWFWRSFASMRNASSKVVFIGCK